MKPEMKKPLNQQVDKNMTINVNNDPLNELLAAYQQENNVENLNKLLNCIVKCRVLIPANLSNKKQPIPCVIKNKDGQNFLPIYTDKKQIPEHLKSPAVMNMPYLTVNHVAAQKEHELEGIVINPFSNNLIFKMALLQQVEEVEKKKKEAPVKKTVKLNGQQYLQFERHQFEAGFLARKLHTEGQAFIDTLSNEKEEYIDRLFEESFKEKRMYPYLPEDFSVMVLNITEDFSVVRIDMPERDMGRGLAFRIYCTWNSRSKKTGYYLICAGEKKGQFMLNEVTSDLRPMTHGEAPAEGAELQTIIDLAEDTAGMTS